MEPKVLLDPFYDALAVGDRTAITAQLADGFVGRLAPGLPFGIGGEHVGAEAMIRDGWFAIGARWRVHADDRAYEALEDGRIQVRGTYRGRGRESGVPFEAPFVHLWEVRDGLLAGLTQVTDSAAFRDALAEPLATIDLAVTDGVAVLRLNRPEARNAIDQDLADELLVAARRVARDPGVRALLICGAGPDLTVGGDIGHFTANAGDDLGALLRGMTTPFHQAFELLAELEVPIVTAAHGAVAGGGLGLVYAADVVVAAEDARFVTAFAQIGLSGDGGGTWHLPRRIGAARAAAAYLLNRPVTAQQALDWGLVTEVMPAGASETRALAIAQRLADGPTQAYAAMRRLLRASWDRTLPEQLHAEIDSLEATARTSDAATAVASFLAKQTPTFTGR